MKRLPILVILAGLLILFVFGDPLYTVHETETVILTRFGQPIGEPITEPGLHWKTPFVIKVNRLEKRILEWDGQPAEMPTKDKTYISVDTFARWRIGDPSKFFVTLRDERSAQSRIEDIIGSEVRTSVAGHDLIEVVRKVTGKLVKLTWAYVQGLAQDHISAMDELEMCFGRMSLASEEQEAADGPRRPAESDAAHSRWLKVYRYAIQANI